MSSYKFTFRGSLGAINAVYFYGHVSCTLEQCLIQISRVLQGSSNVDNSNDGGPEFAEFFVIVWIGSMVVTLNSKLLGGNM